MALMGGLMAASTTGTLNIQQPLGYVPTASPFTVSLTDSLSVASTGYQLGRTYQSLQIKTADSRLLFVSLMNLNPKIPITFTLRSSCVAASDPLPCPSPSSGAPACSSPQQGNCISGSCSCLNGYGGFACSQKISAIQNGSPFTSFPLPGLTWKFFSIDLLGNHTHSGNILFELTQPSGTSSVLQPLLVVTPINASSYGQGFTPDLGNIPSSSLTPRSTSPDSWLLSPWSLSFFFEESSSISRYWSVGVFNAASPLSKASALSSANLTLTVRASSAMEAGQSPAPLCPRDCSGNGVCSYPHFYGNPTTVLACSGNGLCTHQGTDLQNYLCQCDNGYFGSICQSNLAPILPLSSGRQASLGPFPSTPGALDFFQFALLTTSSSGRKLLQNPSYSSFIFKFYLKTDTPPPASFLAAIQTGSTSNAIPLNFSSDGTISLQFTSQVTYSDQVLVAVYNNDMLNASGGVNFMMNVSWTGISSQSNAVFSFTSEWQYGIMVGAWGLFLAAICIGSCYALIRRRWLMMRLSRGSGGSVNIEMGGAQSDAQERRRARSQRQLMVQTIVSKQLLDTLIPITPFTPAELPSPHCTSASGKDEAEAVAGQEAEVDCCTVCIEKFQEGDLVRKLFCGHLFHADCADPWLLKNGSCPVCRQDIVAFPDSPQPAWAVDRPATQPS